ncbi:hypothetical protein PSN45_001147 [Yamadazyma tenuis]|uniref:Uncharacterized protein n=1 Tax=Candida tenuis (strain ATCC 10573 / BCRC 21748 / CBS 615 / JCM 9827 / NBRC 10315 / NRRL Y-1498 / VKM Y-70) TaxID=590646 RepID=G3B8P8_CANTC|nr:uncharacterized protein CANTEDRAFT_115864 [Yamadazyma tenuis ATCC 10573]XP_006689070.1 uncharacterized protein CANTEDRAFT_115864 [Yamadazyma tenuis ATCC 10573]EGV62899.1 hypothetical protein CANTEDRAFT_115864 [Yamadazyma tenuis ATCC 10573]EGV62900.1 hypothetical protein CANTEDRAFT_115864 [Yamadazyma tenuis ATCC 10573]WEJ93675.1 hypothetical protein PSN45_001147 [Yamadazyma tenuis]
MKLSVFHKYITVVLLVINVAFVYKYLHESPLSIPNVFKSTSLSEKFEASLPQNSDPYTIYNRLPIDLANASAVFNTVEGALKQKDANTHPVGISFIPAYIPPNTRLYHSRSDGNVPHSFEWVAFDYEFSYAFAGFQRSTNSSGVIEHNWRGREHTLFTFKNTKSLDKLIFLDGASAAKSGSEMDQQMILSNQTNTTEYVDERVAADKICKWGEKFGLQGIVRLEVGYEMILCDFHKDIELVSNVTLGVVNDLIGFPPDEHKYVHQHPYKPHRKAGDHPHPKGSSDPKGPPGGEFYKYYDYGKRGDEVDDIPDYESLSYNRSLLLSHLRLETGFEWGQAGNTHDFGEDRILLDFSNMVTPINKTYIDPNAYRRNISYISQDLKDDIIHSFEQIYKEPTVPFYKTNWQSITGAITQKFGPMLVNLNSSLYHENLKEVSDRIQLLTFNFVRRYTNDATHGSATQREAAIKISIDDYVFHTFHLRNTDFLIYASIYKVQSEIVNFIFDIFDFSKDLAHDIYIKGEYTSHDEELKRIQKRLSDMLELFNWSISYQCSQTCAFDETCYTPTWGPGPFGWGIQGNTDFFDYDGKTYSIKHEMSCIKYTDAQKDIAPLN